jgi:hypothetical protein
MRVVSVVRRALLPEMQALGGAHVSGRVGARDDHRSSGCSGRRGAIRLPNRDETKRISVRAGIADPIRGVRCLQDFSADSSFRTAGLKIVVSPVRVRVSPCWGPESRMCAGFSSRWCNGFSNFAAHGQQSWSFRFEDASVNWLGYGRCACPRLDAIRVQVGPYRLFVAIFLRRLEGSGGSASDSSDALASASAAGRRQAGGCAGVQVVCDAAAECRFPIRGGVCIGGLMTTRSRPD